MPGQEGDSRQARVDAGPAAGGGPPAGRLHPGTPTTQWVREGRGQRGVQDGGDRQVHTEDRAHAGRPAGQGELHRAVQTVAVGERQGRHAVLGGPGDEIGRVVGPVPHGVAGRDVQMDEGIAHRRGREAGPVAVPPTTRGRA